MPEGRRPSGLTLPEDPSEEELARDWTLSESDRAEVLHRRGDDNRRRFALQLCVLRQYGRFLDRYQEVPVRILNHVNRQLGLTPLVSLPEAERDATESSHQQRLREYLGYRTFDDEARSLLEQHLRSRVAQGAWPEDLFDSAMDALRFWKVVPPAVATIERIASSIGAIGREEMFGRITSRLDESTLQALERVLEVPPGQSRSLLFRFREYPPEATPTSLADYLERYREITSLGVGVLNLSGIPTAVIEHLAQLTRRYDVQALKRFAPETRAAMLVCFLGEAHKSLLDHLIAMHEQYITGLVRRSRHAFDERHREFRKRARRGIQTVLSAMEILLERQMDDPLVALYRQIEESTLRAALEDCREFERIEDHGFQDELRARYSGLRRYLPAFLELPFRAERGAEPLLAAIEVVRKLNRDNVRNLPTGAPDDFVPPSWRASLYRDQGETGRADRRLWELALALALREALRSGGIYIAESRHHVSFSNLIYNQQQWAEDRTTAYAQLNLFEEKDTVIAALTRQFDEVAGVTARSMNDNSFATIVNGRLKLQVRDALPISAEVKTVRGLIESSLPRVRIEDLLRDIDAATHFTRAFRPLGGYEPRSERLYPALLAALIAHGTNLGIAAMGQSAEGISVDTLQHVSRWFLREDTINAANAALVNFHHQLPISRIWGEGIASSSDGQRFGIQQSSLLASYYPWYFGYYDRAIAVYTHTSDQYSVFGTRIISCSPREALYVLDGLLENNTILRLREHYTDTHGFTEHVFGLCYLLGYSFMPRLRDLADQHLYKMDRRADHGCLNPLFHGVADTDLIREQWDFLVRVAASLKNRTAPANVIVQRLVNASSSDRLAGDLTALGRVVKTIFILRYLSDAALRHRVQLQLNRGEARHELVARCLFFANRGEFRSGDAEEIMNKVSCLSLLSNAVLVWNTLRIAEIVNQSRQAGHAITDQGLARVSPLMHGHVIPNGTYRFGDEEEPPRVYAAAS
jgi:TnpA family transposase